MISALASFLVSFVLTLLIIKFSQNVKQVMDHELEGSQKMHAIPVPRIGGVGIFVAFLVGTSITYLRYPEVGLWIATLMVPAAIVFGCGIEEDYTKKVSPRRRLLLIMIASAIGYYLLNATVSRIDVPLIDGYLAYPWLSLPLTVFAVSGIVNAINIIDGYNGLASVVSIFILLSISYVAFQVGDAYVMSACFILIGAIAGFLLWNYPNGLIFMGDGGAYFIGFMIGELAVLLVARNPQVSAWYALLVLIYPIFETLFSIYRKKFIRGTSPGLPDGIHLHMLVFKRLVRWAIANNDARNLTLRNSLTSPYLWLLSLSAVIPATMFWNHTWVLVIFCVFFIAIYIWLYLQIINFKTPSWMILRHKEEKAHKDE